MVIPRDGNLHFKVVILGNMFEKLLYFLLVLFRKVWYYYRPQRSCGQGNVFTGVCLSTGGRVSASVHAGMPDPPPPDQADTPPGPGRQPPLPRSRLQHTVYERPVRIPLECILVPETGHVQNSETRDLIWRSVVFYINNLLVFPSATTVTEDPE